MPALPMPSAGGGRVVAPLDDGRPLEPGNGTAGKEQPYGHVVVPYDEQDPSPRARVIVRLVPDADQTPSGLLVVPDAARGRPNAGARGRRRPWARVPQRADRPDRPAPRRPRGLQEVGRRERLRPEPGPDPRRREPGRGSHVVLENVDDGPQGIWQPPALERS